MSNLRMLPYAYGKMSPDTRLVPSVNEILLTILQGLVRFC